jgi:hypothetical protein
MEHTVATVSLLLSGLILARGDRSIARYRTSVPLTIHILFYSLNATQESRSGNGRPGTARLALFVCSEPERSWKVKISSFQRDAYNQSFRHRPRLHLGLALPGRLCRVFFWICCVYCESTCRIGQHSIPMAGGTGTIHPSSSSIPQCFVHDLWFTVRLLD